MSYDESKYFFCEAYGVRLYKPICVDRLKQAKKATTKKLKKKWKHCIDCEQGREIAEELSTEGQSWTLPAESCELCRRHS